MNDTKKVDPPRPSSNSELTFTNAPNLLTLLRIGFVPLVVGMLFMGTPKWDLLAALAFGLASITDYFDGYLARRHQQVTIYGKLMDPLADKFLIVSSIIMLQYLGRIHPIVVMLLICRELAITGLRALASAEGVIIAASDGAKWKTATQMLAIPFIMAGSPASGGRDLWLGLPVYPIGLGLLYISLALSLWSAKDYVVGFFKGLHEARKARLRERRLAREVRRQAREARLATKAPQITPKKT